MVRGGVNRGRRFKWQGERHHVYKGKIMVPSIAADRHYPNAIKSFAHILLVALTFIFQNASAQNSSDQKLTLQGLIVTASNF
jgi:hypothetical protein